jgi:hypothetical protein
MKEKTIVAGSGNVSVETRSNGALSSTASSSSSTVARMRSSIAATRRGVNARDAGRRRRVWAGGSSETIEGWGRWPPSARTFSASGTSGTIGSCAVAAE